jgi:GAF domain-containing protein
VQEQPRSRGPSLAQARATIQRQADELEHLRQQLTAASFGVEFGRAVTLAASAAAIAAPVSHTRLLEMIVEAAASVMGARAASLFLIDDETQELVFAVALGSRAEQVRQFRIPLGHGVAGLAALTGQPMAISNASSDPRHAADIAERVGYTPESILAVPLFASGEVIGVFELLDKEGLGSFGPQDMEVLGLFANQAAVAIQQSRSFAGLAALILGPLASLGELPAEQREALATATRSFATAYEQDPAYRQALHLARLVQEIVARGERETMACQTILEGFAAYLRARAWPGDEPMSLAW